MVPLYGRGSCWSFSFGGGETVLHALKIAFRVYDSLVRYHWHLNTGGLDVDTFRC